MGIIRTVITGVVGVGIVSAGAWALDETTRNDQGAIVESGDLGVFDFKVGDCLIDLPSGGSVGKATGVPCSDPHQFEVYAETFLGDEVETLPKDISDQASEFCSPEFEKFVGLDYDNSVLMFTTLYPTQESWDGGDKEISCLIAAEEDKLTTGTLGGANR